jgi:hypothetical protein
MPSSAADTHAARPSENGGKTSLLWWGLGVAVLFCYWQMFSDRYVDDTYITLSYATTLAKFGAWGMAPDLTSNAATSPLHVVLLAAAIKIFRAPLLALTVLNVLVSVLIFCNLRYFSRKLLGGETFGLLTTALLLTNPLLTSTQGLESYLLIGLVLLACRLWDRQHSPSLGLVLGFLCLTRPDAAAVGFVFVAMLCVQRKWSTGLQVLCCCLLPTLPWCIYSWYHLGSLVPDTLLIKRNQGSWYGYSFFDGALLYWERCRVPLVLSVVLAPGVLLMRRMAGARLSLLAGLGGYALLHFVTYSCLHVPPYHWYYAAEVTAIAVFGAMGVYDASTRFRPVAVAGLALMVLLSASCSLHSVVVDGTPAMATNWATAQQYKEIAGWINQNVPDRRIRIGVELGTVQYYTHADMIDTFSDRSLIVKALHEPHSRLGGALLRFNYKHLHTEDFSQIRYELFPCMGGTPMKEWATITPYSGPRRWCFYKLPLPVLEH